jgi:mRNA interferase RelE/StbE
MKTVTYSGIAALALRKHANRAKLIRSKVSQYAADPAAQANNVKKLTDINACRLRVGGFRVIFSETAETITVLDIGPRGDIYD